MRLSKLYNDIKETQKILSQYEGDSLFCLHHYNDEVLVSMFPKTGASLEDRRISCGDITIAICDNVSEEEQEKMINYLSDNNLI